MVRYIIQIIKFRNGPAITIFSFSIPPLANETSPAERNEMKTMFADNFFKLRDNEIVYYVLTYLQIRFFMEAGGDIYCSADR